MSTTVAEQMYQAVKAERDAHKAMLLDIYQRLADARGFQAWEVRRDIAQTLNLHPENS